jgi:uracil-DNA glycosylase family 4
VRDQILDAMGIQQWLLKKKPGSLFVSDNPLFCAACLVLLPKNPSLNLEQKKILTGMLNVLTLNAEELCIAWVEGVLMRDQIQRVGQEIAKWSPYSVLIMGENFAQQLLETDRSLDELRLNFQSMAGTNALVQVTYHPEALLQSKALKTKAYRDLLCLKDQISSVRSE